MGVQCKCSTLCLFAMVHFRVVKYMIALFLMVSCVDHRDDRGGRGDALTERVNYDSLVARACTVDSALLNNQDETNCVLEDGTKQFRYSLYEMNYLPAKDFLFRENIYRQDGSLFMSYYALFDVPVGSMCTYDEKGALLMKDDWNSEYKGCKVDPSMLVAFLEKEGWYNRSTGESVVVDSDSLGVGGDFTYNVFNHIIVDFFPSSELQNYPVWVVLLPNIIRTPKMFVDKYLQHETKTGEGSAPVCNVTYVINAQSGKYSVRWERGHVR